MLAKEQEELVALIIQGEKITDIANKLDKARSTIYEWLNRDDVKADLDKRRRELINQGNQLIMRDLSSYIDNIKDLADDKSDKRVCLAANQYLINRIYGNPASVIETNDNNEGDNVNENELELEITKFKGILKNRHV